MAGKILIAPFAGDELLTNESKSKKSFIVISCLFKIVTWVYYYFDYSVIKSQDYSVTLPLLTTKLNIPPLRLDLVQRSHLIEQLNKGLHGKLSIVSAPAGFGKTTALVEWLNLTDRTAAWLALDKGDNDVSHFLNYFISALSTIDKSFGKGIPCMPLVPQAPSKNAILSELINALAVYPGNLIIVLDDYYHIENQEVHDMVSYFLEHQPENTHLIIASRFDPPLPISRLRGQGQLMEIRLKDLRFTREEITKFLNEIMELGLNPEDIDLLAERTEGWIVSLQLLAMSLQKREDKQEFVASFSGGHHYIVDYLADEILSNQSEALQTFLCQTSILDRFCVPLADTVLEITSSQELMRDLLSANLLLIPLDNDRQWFRYHHLFADYLRQRIKEDDPENIAGLHRRASKWFSENGFLEEAIKHGLQAEEYEFVVTLIENNAESFWWRGEHTTLHQWLSALPDEIVISRPRLNIGLAITHMMAGQNEESENRLKLAENILEQNGAVKDKAELHGMIAAIRASIAFLIHGDVPATIEYSQKALELLPEENATWRSVIALDSGDAHSLTGDLEAAKLDYHQAVTASKQTGHAFLLTVSSAKLANNYLVRGHLHAGAETVQQALDFSEEQGVLQTPRSALLFIILADILCEWNQLTEAFNCVEKGIKLSQQTNNILTIAWGYRTLTKILFSKDDLSGAHKAVQRLEGLARKTELPSYINSSLVFWKVRLEIAKSRFDQSRLRNAERMLQDQEISQSDDNISYDTFLRYFSLARLLIAQKKYDQAEKNLDQLMHISESWGYASGLIELLVLKSITFYAQNKVVQAIAVLEDALAKAEPEGYIRLFVDEGKPMADLLQQIRDKGIFVDYIDALISAFKETIGIKPAQLEQPLIEQLSKRELEILSLLITELSVPEIADELMVSANTVRTHTRNIYAKLGVHNRRSAVRKAQELKLV